MKAYKHKVLKVLFVLLQQRQQLVTALISANDTSDILTAPLLEALDNFDKHYSELLSNLQQTKL